LAVFHCVNSLAVGLVLLSHFSALPSPQITGENV
jgi:hypothetical protein